MNKKDYDLIRSALVGLVGVDTKEELDQMELIIRAAPVSASDKAATIDAIDALRKTLEATTEYTN